MKNYIGLSVVILVFGLLIYVYISIADFTPKEDKLLEKIIELELKIDSLSNRKDSIKTIIDSTHIKIITNEKHYQERVNTILIQSSSADSSYVSNYIRQYADKNSMLNIE